MADENANEYEVGVLFVHGIGEQEPGETLISYSDPMREFIHQWLTNARDPRCKYNGGYCTVHRGELNPPEDPDDQEPPHLDLLMVANTKQKDQNKDNPVISTWLLAECHWAKSFPPPTALDVTRWSIPVVPWAVASHFARRIELAKPRVFPYVAQLFEAFLFALPLVVAIELTMFALAILSLIPIEKTQSFARSGEQYIALFLGDSYVYIASPTRLSAIVTRFHHDLEWLMERCDQVVVVGHSQGAAIVVQGLLMANMPKLKLVVTLGAGIYKLWELQWYRLKHVVPVDLALHALLWLNIIWAAWNMCAATIPNVLYSITAIAVGNFLHLGLILLWRQTQSVELESLFARYRELGLPQSWLDFYASKDPVSNGAMSVKLTSASRRIHNLGSVLFDHTSYTDNVIEFVASLVTAISSHAESKIPLHALSRNDNAALLAGIKVRRWLVQYRVGFRWFLILSTIIVMFTSAALTRKLGLRILHLNAPWWTGWVARFTPLQIGSATVALLALGVYGIFVAVWNTYMDLQTQFLCQRVCGGSDPSVSIYLFCGNVCLVAVLGAVLAPIVRLQNLPPNVYVGIAIILVIALTALMSKSFDRATKQGSVANFERGGE